ncbi:MAG: lysophospholipase [Cryobacterium sp.]|jgi:pimeloyl-ACP methyl ester carboxylesterase|nr:lysophospholipase [Cryobacterium sp.]
MTQITASADGSTIAYDMVGSGPPLIIIGGAFNTRHSAGDIAALLAADFSVYSYDRRGRGDSTETKPYAIDREVEDVVALVKAAGGSAVVYGHSSGAALALEAAVQGAALSKLALYEPPLTTPAHGGSPAAWATQVQAAVDAGDREAAATLFLRGSGADDASIDAVRNLPWWPGMLAMAHTLPYDIVLLGDGTVPVERLASVTAPTLLMFGGDSPPWAEQVATAAAGAMSQGTTLRIAGSGHNVDASTIAPILRGFFSGAA